MSGNHAAPPAAPRAHPEALRRLAAGARAGAAPAGQPWSRDQKCGERGPEGQSPAYSSVAAGETHEPVGGRRLGDRLPEAWRSPRWQLSPSTGVVAVLAVLLVCAAVVVVAVLARPGATAPQPVPARSGTPHASPDAGQPVGGQPVGGQPAGGQPDGQAPEGAADEAVLPSGSPTGQPGATAGEMPPPGTVVVHVVGQVADPGVVELPSTARVADAVDATGGLTADADVTRVNLARPLVDGEQVLVPRPGEEVPDAAPVPGRDTDDAGADGSASGTDLNAADATDLQALPGIGPVLAQRIVQWREEHGRFSSVEELTEVTGIGPSLLEQLRPLVRV